MKKYIKQSVESDVSSIEGALAQTAKSEMGGTSPRKLAQGSPKDVEGYTSLGKGIVPLSKNNRGGGT